MSGAIEADIIVVGGGSAGCAMAARLSERGDVSVLLLEAGRSDRHPFTRIPAANIKAVQNPDFDWCYKAEPDPSIGGRADVWAAGKVLGGGSAINGMIYIRGHARDYDRWAELGATGWDHASVLPYFRRLETNERGADDHRGGDGPLAVSEGRARYPITDAWIDAAVEAGIPRSPDLNGASAEGVDHIQVSQKGGWRHSTAAAYIWPNIRRPNLTVELNAVSSRILFEGKRATGVEYEQGGEVKRAVARRGVVVCAGAMNSPRLLMLSGIGPAAHLTAMGVPVVHDLPGVGANLQDHVGSHLVNAVSGKTLNVDVGGLNGIKHLCGFGLGRRGALTTSIGHAQALVKTRDHLRAPNVQLAFAPLAFDLDAQGKIVLRKEPSVSTAIAVLHPKSRGTVTLRAPDPKAPPVITHQLLGEEDDLTQMVEGFAIARRIMAQPAIARYVRSEVRPATAEEDAEGLRMMARMTSTTFYHPVGTCRMGQDDMAVVDPDLRVRGVDGLWVADASIMPALVAGNTNATAIMIGDKGSAHVLKTLTNRA
ncbi:MAG: GMC family oxidoreductase N-terminal domain-containing protein [Sphingomonas fennica]